MSSEENTHADSNEISMLTWRCRRGMKELDQLMLRYLNVYYPSAPEAQKRAFRSLLTDFEEPHLYSLLCGRLTIDDMDISDVIKVIRSSSAINFS